MQSKADAYPYPGCAKEAARCQRPGASSAGLPWKARWHQWLLICLGLLFVFGGLSSASAQQNPTVDEAVRAARESGVPESTLNRLLLAGYRYQIDSTTMAHWITAMGGAAAKGLPCAPLIEKLDEGLSKRIPVERITAVLDQQTQHLSAAAQLLGPAHGSPEAANDEAVSRMADLMMTSLTIEEIRAILNQPALATTQERLEAATFYAVLKQSGLPPDACLELVSNGLQRHFFTNFPTQLAYTVKAAQNQKIAQERIVSETMRVIKGEQSAPQMQESLKIGPVFGPALNAPAGSGGMGPNSRGSGSGSGGKGGGSSGGRGGGSSGGGSGSGGHGSGSGGGGHGGHGGGGHGGGH